MPIGVTQIAYLLQRLTQLRAFQKYSCQFNLIITKFETLNSLEVLNWETAFYGTDIRGALSRAAFKCNYTQDKNLLRILCGG